MKALDRAAAVWGTASIRTGEQTLDGDPVRHDRRPPVIPSAAEIASWGKTGQDLSQLVTDSGAVPAGTVSWSQIPTGLWYPHGSPAGDFQAFVNSMQCPPEHRPGGGGVPTAS